MANISAVHAPLPVSEALGDAGRAMVAGANRNKSVVALHEPREAGKGSKPILASEAPPLPGLREVHLQLHIDERTGEVFGRFVDPHTGDKVREIPSQQLRAFAAQIKGLFDHPLDRTA